MPKKKRPAPTDNGADDPLGKLLSDYHVSLAGVLVVSGVIAPLGLGGLGYGRTRKPVSLIAAGLGGRALVMAVALLVMNVFNVGRRLEVRKRGLRYTEAGVETEFRWDEVAAVDVDRTDSTNSGVASARRRSSDAVGPSGPLTSTDWDVTIRGTDGRSVHLPPVFWKMVGDPKGVIAQIRMRAGVE